MDTNSKKQFILKSLASLEKLQQLHKQIRDIDVSVSELHPVTLVENDTFFVFDLNKSGEEYEYKLEAYLETEDYNNVFHYHRQMKESLDRIDYEYMIWQEWKEGYARYIENIIRNRIGVKTNTNKLLPQFSRVSFYEIGSKYISLLINNNPYLKNDINELYVKMFNI